MTRSVRVLDARSRPVQYRDNTVIVLTADHGYHVGEKDCIQKWHLWDESTRVPLFIHVPEWSGKWTELASAPFL